MKRQERISMTHDDMSHYIRLVENTARDEDAILVEDISEDLRLDLDSGMLMEDLGDVMFKMQSYRENRGSQEYALGVEEGLLLASDMLQRIIERHSK
jgi:hypothetical protein